MAVAGQRHFDFCVRALSLISGIPSVIVCLILLSLYKLAFSINVITRELYSAIRVSAFKCYRVENIDMKLLC